MQKQAKFVENIKNEFSVDENGVVFASQKAVAQLCGVTTQSIAGLLIKLTEKLTPPKVLEDFIGEDFRGQKLPDNLFEKIIEYYAFDAGRYCTERAKLVYRTFSKVRLRREISRELNFKPKIKANKLDLAKYIVDRSELLGLKSESLLSLRSYVYFALRIDGIEKSMHQIDSQEFCDRWCINESDYLVAIASLKKKGVINVDIPDFELRAYSHQEKLDLIENQFNYE